MVSGASTTARGAPLATGRSRGGTRPPDRRRHRDQVPLLRHSPSRAKSSGSYTSSGRPTSSIGPSSDSSARDPFDRASVRAIHGLDRTTLGEARRLFAISRNVADRLQRSTGLEAEVLPPPPQQLEYRSSDGVGTFILSVGRLDRAKRVDLLLEAAAVDRSLRVVVAGDGPDRERLEQFSAQNELDGRVTFAGRVTEKELVDLYADCLAVFYAPFDEDFGFVPYEAFLSSKPVVTTRDAGGPLEVVVDRENGFVCEPVPAAVAAACSWLAANPDQALACGRSGKRTAERVTWDNVLDRLVAS